MKQKPRGKGSLHLSRATTKARPAVHADHLEGGLRLLWDEPKIFFLERRYFFSIILSEFLKNRVALHECLLTCKKISEGIDISSVTNIFLFASDRSKLVTTQRIGRALRLDKKNPNKKAIVIDFILEDAVENDNNADQERKEWLTGLSRTRRTEDEE